ncbi:MAG: glycosyltransferase [Verrucomicrobiia bacterium]
MRVLCLSPFFPPSGDSESFCGGKMVLALGEKGVDVTVLHMDSENLFPPDSSARWAGLRSKSHLIAETARGRGLASAFWALRFRLPAYARWVKPAVDRAVEAHKEKPFDLIYSRSLPFFAHVAGFWISRKLRLPWVANVNDPWDLHHFPERRVQTVPSLYTRMSDYWLRKVLACADAVTFPSRRLALFTARLPECRARMEVIPHVSAVSTTPKALPGFTLVHAGKLGTNEITGRSSVALLNGLKRFLGSHPVAGKEVRMIFVGPADSETEEAVGQIGLSKSVVLTGRVNYDASLDLIGGASACILIEADMQEGLYLPSKMVDYLAAGKPVLALSPKVGTVRDMSTDSAVMPLDQHDDCGIAYAIGLLYRAHSAGDLRSLAPSETLAKTFSPDLVASRFLAFASQLSPALAKAIDRLTGA